MFKTANKHEFNFKVNLCQIGGFYGNVRLASQRGIAKYEKAPLKIDILHRSKHFVSLRVDRLKERSRNVAHSIACSKMTCLVHPLTKWRVLYTPLQNGLFCTPSYKMLCLVYPVTKWRFLYTLLQNGVSSVP